MNSSSNPMDLVLFSLNDVLSKCSSSCASIACDVVGKLAGSRQSFGWTILALAKYCARFPEDEGIASQRCMCVRVKMG
ncbi:hypothetical protein WICPIJ_002823 [Wickerhamomyces pijperi]|uniref:Uncharacterized protein n=1 Tax=Wickerhamomyces pijperi TaxID=599730 RepID=A0A9P8QB31_WICPI|nr:hypothetical protein WICPIJ_002823 [Wickerhamomyces pijperi]